MTYFTVKAYADNTIVTVSDCTDTCGVFGKIRAKRAGFKYTVNSYRRIDWIVYRCVNCFGLRASLFSTNNNRMYITLVAKIEELE